MAGVNLHSSIDAPRYLVEGYVPHLTDFADRRTPDPDLSPTSDSAVSTGSLGAPHC
jgi:hypothetical protein